MNIAGGLVGAAEAVSAASGSNALELLGTACSGRQTRKIIVYVLNHPATPFTVSGTTRATKTSKGLVSILFSRLRKKKILYSKKNEGKKLFLNTDSFLVRELKKLINAELIRAALLELDALDAPFGKIGKIGEAGFKALLLYGSWAEGTNSEKSDVDLCLLAEKPVSETLVASASAALSRQLNADVHILVLDLQRKEKLKKESPAFYYSVMFKSILLAGEAVEG